MLKRCKILQLSVGSMLGQNVLDVLESRRDRVTLVGASTEVENPRIFRCDRVYRVPVLADGAAFRRRFREILQAERPDLILPGRDDDVVFLAEFREQEPQWAGAIPCGRSAIARIVRDKFATWRWASEHRLPFARSFVYQGPADDKALDDFVAAVGYPMIAKPREGFGSQGVFIVPDEGVLASLLRIEGLLVQEYLMPRADLGDRLRAYRLAPPLFFQIPEDHQYAAQMLIGPDGTLGEKYTSVSRMVLGRCERLERVREPAMEALLEVYGRALYVQGWQGFVNVQCKPDAAGVWKAHEINLRMSGGTSARLLTGHDEIGRMMKAFYPQFGFPDLGRRPPPEGVVVRTLTDNFVSAEDMRCFAADQSWSAPP